MKVLIKDVKVKKRARKNIKEIEELADSIKRNGLLNPIIIDQNNVLIAGERRLRAMELLERTHIDATMVSVDSAAQALEIEIEENTQRQSFSKDELIKAYTKLNKIQQPNIIFKFCLYLIDFFRRLFKKDRKSEG